LNQSSWVKSVSAVSPQQADSPIGLLKLLINAQPAGLELASEQDRYYTETIHPVSQFQPEIRILQAGL
jgi:hypothetical protein